MTQSILITGAGGAAAVSFMKAIANEGWTVHAADMDPMAPGLFMVPPERRHVVPPGGHPDFAIRLLQLALDVGAHVVVPTVDVELEPVARARRAFQTHGILPMVPSRDALVTCLDKAELMRAVPEAIAPRWAILDDAFDGDDWPLPLVAKPRTGAGGRGVEIVHTREHLERLPRDGHLLVQEHLPGEEYSVDVLLDPEGAVWATVPRSRMRTDSGVAIVARTVRDPDLMARARAAAAAAGLSWVCNVQLRRDRNGVPKLLEINPRFPGTMSLTVASGVNMPSIALQMATAVRAGRTMARPDLHFAELGMVRTWQERYVLAHELHDGARPHAAIKVA